MADYKKGYNIILRPGFYDYKSNSRRLPGLDVKRALIDFMVDMGLATTEDYCTLTLAAGEGLEFTELNSISSLPEEVGPTGSVILKESGVLGDHELYISDGEQWVYIGYAVYSAANIRTLAAPFVHQVNAQTGTTYTLVLADGERIVTLNNGSAITLTIPTNASVGFTIGQEIPIIALGAGQVTVVGAGGVTVNGTPGLKLTSQYSAASLIKLAADTWVIVGDLSA
jgi:hypothetical protein